MKTPNNLPLQSDTFTMPPYTSEANKGILFYHLDHGVPIIQAAKEASIEIRTARRLKKRSDEIISEAQRDEEDKENQPPITYYDRSFIKPKSGRKRVFSETQIETLDTAIRESRESREMTFFEVAQQPHLDLPECSRWTVDRAAKEAGNSRVKPTKKLALTPIQEAVRYEISLSRKN